MTKCRKILWIFIPVQRTRECQVFKVWVFGRPRFVCIWPNAVKFCGYICTPVQGTRECQDWTVCEVKIYNRCAPSTCKMSLSWHHTKRADLMWKARTSSPVHGNPLFLRLFMEFIRKNYLLFNPFRKTVVLVCEWLVLVQANSGEIWNALDPFLPTLPIWEGNSSFDPNVIH